jgi:hypothetical protein
MVCQTSHTDWAISLDTEFRMPSLNGSHNCERVEEEESSHTLPFPRLVFPFYQNCIFEDFFCYGSNQHSSKAHPDFTFDTQRPESTTFWCNIDFTCFFFLRARAGLLHCGNNEKNGWALLSNPFEILPWVFLLEIGGFIGLDALTCFSCLGRLFGLFVLYSAFIDER